MIEQTRTSYLRPRPAARRPMPELWEQVAVVGLFFALLDGYGAYYQLYTFSPTKYIGLQLVLMMAALGLCPRGAMRTVYLPMAAVWFFGWWLASYFWVGSRHDWIRIAGRDLTLVVALVVLGQLVGHARFIRTLMVAGYAAIALIFLTFAVAPGRAYSSSGPAPGLHGGFIHKNAMAPCLLLTLVVVLTFHASPRFKVGFVVLVTALLYLGQTTTGLATMLVIIVMSFMLDRYNSTVASLGRAAATLLTASAVALLLLAMEAFSFAVRLSGKDLTFSARTVIWSGVTDAVSRRPWTGYGYSVWTNLWVEPVRTINIHNGFIVAESHNAALEMLIRLGVVGLVLYVLQFISTVRWGMNGLVRNDPQGKASLLYAAIVVVVGFSEALTGFGVWFGLLVLFGAYGAVRARDAAKAKTSDV